ncbi:MAG TPA: GntR family transcriptional regulator [Chloroflexota bacterium]|nr:GntR family transcriptional regulator [Chloroflexota bacterium]
MQSPEPRPRRSFTPVRHPSLADTVLIALRRAIVNGDIEPGQRLVETDLADQFHVSRATIRQALERCKVEGLIEIRPRRGAVVTRMSNDVARDVCVVRGVLESWVARTSCRRLTDQDLERMRALSREMGDLVRSGDVYGVAERDIEFHSLILRGDTNAYLRERWDSLNALHGALLASRLAYYDYDPAGVIERHLDLVGALARRDPDVAEHAVRGHYIAPFIPDESETTTIVSLDALKRPAREARYD